LSSFAWYSLVEIAFERSSPHAGAQGLRERHNRYRRRNRKTFKKPLKTCKRKTLPIYPKLPILRRVLQAVLANVTNCRAGPTGRMRMAESCQGIVRHENLTRTGHGGCGVMSHDAKSRLPLYIRDAVGIIRGPTGTVCHSTGATTGISHPIPPCYRSNDSSTESCSARTCGLLEETQHHATKNWRFLSVHRSVVWRRRIVRSLDRHLASDTIWLPG
jgi:hypothetical protein